MDEDQLDKIEEEHFKQWKKYVQKFSGLGEHGELLKQNTCIGMEWDVGVCDRKWVEKRPELCGGEWLSSF